MPHPLLIFSQSDYLIQIVDINLHTEWQTVQIQISWLLKKPTDLDLHCLQRQGISGFSMTRVNNAKVLGTTERMKPVMVEITILCTALDKALSFNQQILIFIFHISPLKHVVGSG